MTSVKPDKINGLSFVGSREAITEQHVTPVVEVNANYASIMPFGFIRNIDHPEIIYNTERQWFGETRLGAIQYIEELRRKNIKIMLKPHIWVWRGEFTGLIEMTNEENWNLLEESYSNFILEYAEMAQQLEVEIFCIGTELEKFIMNRPEFWNTLIVNVRAIYSGKLTYASNWDEFKRTPFWDELDYIGIDAYFPVSDSQTPTLEECRMGWTEHKVHIKDISKKYDKPILFTEFGYRSVDYAGKEPWKSDRSMNQVNLNAQTNTTMALFHEFWGEYWFAGGFVWKWYHNNEGAGGIDNSRFTPQNKPAEDVIKDAYLRH